MSAGQWIEVALPTRARNPNTWIQRFEADIAPPSAAFISLLELDLSIEPDFELQPDDAQHHGRRKRLGSVG